MHQRLIQTQVCGTVARLLSNVLALVCQENQPHTENIQNAHCLLPFRLSGFQRN